MPRESLPPEFLTPAGRRRRKNDVCCDAFGVSWQELLCLVAIVASHRFGMTTFRRDVVRLVNEEGFHHADFSQLVKLRLVREVAYHGNVVEYSPTLTGISKLGSFGLERGEAAAE